MTPAAAVEPDDSKQWVAKRPTRGLVSQTWGPTSNHPLLTVSHGFGCKEGQATCQQGKEVGTC